MVFQHKPQTMDWLLSPVSRQQRQRAHELMEIISL
jgi:hypothetical protein